MKRDCWQHLANTQSTITAPLGKKFLMGAVLFIWVTKKDMRLELQNLLWQKL